MAEQSIKKVATQAEPVDISDGQVIDKIDSEQGNMDKQTLEALQDYQPDSDLEKKLVRKVDLLLIPTLWFMCVLCFMDRSNIVSRPPTVSPIFLLLYPAREMPTQPV